MATGWFKAKGGKDAIATSYWFAAGDSENPFTKGAVGLRIRCSGRSGTVEITAAPNATTRSVPFDPKKYTLGSSKEGELQVAVTPEVGGAFELVLGTIDITTFDKERIEGDLLLQGKVAGAGDVKIDGHFGFKCPGYSGCTTTD